MWDWRPTWSAKFTARARDGAPDVAASVTLFVIASLAAGRVWRFPFDDEINTLSVIQRFSTLKLVAVFPGRADVHPPLSYLVFHGLQQWGASPAAMRLVSLAMTGLVLALFHFLTLHLLAERSRRPVSSASRLIAVLLFGLCPLAVSQGDALRWYPLFAALIALFVTGYIVAANDAARLCAAVALGLAASTNLLAAPVALAFAVYRYVMQRCFRPGYDAAFWLLVLLFGSLGVYTASSLLFDRFGAVENKLGNGLIRTALTDMLGFFGGDALGVSRAWIVIPAMILASWAVLSSIERKHADAPAHLWLLMFVPAVLMVMTGLAEPRALLYLVPVVAGLLTLLLDSLLRQGHVRWVLATAALLMATSVAAIANIAHSTHPFKREVVIPYETIFDFIKSNSSGRVLVASTDPVVPWTLNRQDKSTLCTAYFLRVRTCLAADRRYDSIFVVHGYSDHSSMAALMHRFDNVLDAVTTGRQKVATLRAGRDDDAVLKQWLTGVPLEKSILTVDLYR
jgi:hypothetical protein